MPKPQGDTKQKIERYLNHAEDRRIRELLDKAQESSTKK